MPKHPWKGSLNARRLKLALAIIGLILTVIAIRLKDDRITWVAIAFLAAAFLMRFFAPSEGRKRSGS